MKGKKVFLAFVIVSFVISAAGQRYTRSEYIRKYQLLAISEMNRSGIPASIKMAQACLESADGNSEMARKSNNHFGIKCKGNWNGAKAYFDDDARNECFRKYRNAGDSYIDHTNFLLGNQRYAFLFKLPPTDYAAWAKGLKKAGYATDPAYDKKVIAIIEENQLWQLDREMTPEERVEFERQRIPAQLDGRLLINPYSTRGISLHNGLRSAVTREGDSFDLLAQEFGLKPWELLKYNDYPDGFEPRPGEIIYLQPKKGKAPGMYQYHPVAEGESMHYISQLYGIRLRSLYRVNKLHYGETVAVGTLLKLQKKAG